MEAGSKDIQTLISRLSAKELEWTEAATLIQRILKEEMQSGNKKKDVIKKVRNLFEEERQKSIAEAREKVLNNLDIDRLDEQLEQFLWDLFIANKRPQDHINYDLMNIIPNVPASLLSECTNTLFVLDVLKNREIDSKTRTRLSAIFMQVVVESSSQSGGSNAGNAGEMVTEVLLEAVGLQKGRDFKTQHKSHSGSDTDFVLPYVDNYKDQDVEIYLAVQFSTNDRLRMVSGELKAGGSGYILTATGTRVASKGIKDIGLAILQTIKDKNQHLVFNKQALEQFIKKLSADSQVTKKNGELREDSIIAAGKLDFYQNYALSWSEFALKMRHRFVRSD